MCYDDHDSPRTEPRKGVTCRSCGQDATFPHRCEPFRPAAMIASVATVPSIKDIATALNHHATAAFADRKDARAARLRDMADELLGEGEHRPKPCTSHDC